MQKVIPERMLKSVCKTVDLAERNCTYIHCFQSGRVKVYSYLVGFIEMYRFGLGLWREGMAVDMKMQG